MWVNDLGPHFLRDFTMPDPNPTSWPPAPESIEPKTPVRKASAVSGGISLVMGALQFGFFLLMFADDFSERHWNRPILPPITISFGGYGLVIFWTATFFWFVCTIASGVVGRRSIMGKIGLAEAGLTVVCIAVMLANWGGT